jgi:hypothetical protein
MNKLKLEKSKRDQLILVVLSTGILLAGLWFGLMNFQKQSLKNLDQRKALAQKKLKEVDQTIRNADKIETDLENSGKALTKLEEHMADSRDLFSWIVKEVREFNTYKIVIPSFSQPVEADMNLLPGFPYRQVTLTIGGTAYFHDFGKFVAEFENHFPHARLMNLDLFPAPQNDPEKLQFKMDIVLLVKPNAA